MPRTVHGFETGDLPMTALIDEIRFDRLQTAEPSVQCLAIEDRPIALLHAVVWVAPIYGLKPCAKFSRRSRLEGEPS
jgi:hypothetical protein